MTNSSVISFPDKFVEEVERLFVDNSKAIEYAKTGNNKLGSVLNDDSFDINPNLIVTAFEASYSADDLEKLEEVLPSSLYGLYIAAKRQQDIENLFGWFLEIVIFD